MRKFSFEVWFSNRTFLELILRYFQVQAFVQGEPLPGDGHNGKVHIFSPPGYDENALLCIACLSHYTACPLQPELSTPP